MRCPIVRPIRRPAAERRRHHMIDLERLRMIRAERPIDQPTTQPADRFLRFDLRPHLLQAATDKPGHVTRTATISTSHRTASICGDVPAVSAIRMFGRSEALPDRPVNRAGPIGIVNVVDAPVRQLSTVV